MTSSATASVSSVDTFLERDTYWIGLWVVVGGVKWTITTDVFSNEKQNIGTGNTTTAEPLLQVTANKSFRIRPQFAAGDITTQTLTKE